MPPRVKEFIQRIKEASRPGDITDLVLNIGLALTSYEHFVTIDEQGRRKRDPRNLLFGPIALKLAQAPNIIASAGGLAALVGLGLTVSGGVIDFPDFSSWENLVEGEKERAKKSPFAVRI